MSARECGRELENRILRLVESFLSLGANDLRPVLSRGFLDNLPGLPATICESGQNDWGTTESLGAGGGRPESGGDEPRALRRKPEIICIGGVPSGDDMLGSKEALDARRSLGGALAECKRSWSFECCWLSAFCAFSMLVRLTPLIIKAFTVSAIATLKFLSVFSFERRSVHISVHRPPRQSSGLISVLDIGTKSDVFRMTSRCASSCQVDPSCCELILSMNGKTSLANSDSLPNRSLLREPLFAEKVLAERGDLAEDMLGFCFTMQA